MEKEDFSYLMKDFSAITSIFIKWNTIILSKTRFWIKFLEKHNIKNLSKWINNPIYIK